MEVLTRTTATNALASQMSPREATESSRLSVSQVIASYIETEEPEAIQQMTGDAAAAPEAAPAADAEPATQLSNCLDPSDPFCM